jgi:hypothetical protein
MAQNLVEPKVITDFNNDPVCILPSGFLLSEERWALIWSLHEKLNRFINHDELRKLFPEDNSLASGKITGALKNQND